MNNILEEVVQLMLAQPLALCKEWQRMSMPKFPNANEYPRKEDALSAILASIAVEETALAEILKAESKKLRFVINNIDPNNEKQMELLLKFNCSVASVIEQINDLQLILKNKLRIAAGCMPCPCPTPPTPPTPPPPPPKPPRPCCNYCKEFTKLPFPYNDFCPPQQQEFMAKG